MHAKPATASRHFDMLFPALAVALAGIVVASPLQAIGKERQCPSPNFSPC